MMVYIYSRFFDFKRDIDFPLMYVSWSRLGVSSVSAHHLWCLFIMNFHYCNEWTCMGIKVMKLICNTTVNLEYLI